MSAEDDRLREAFASRSGKAAGGCPPDSRIWESAAGGLGPAENEEVLLHTAECALCAASWRVARRMIHSEAGVAGLEDPRAPVGWRAGWVPLAAAATLLVAAALVGTRFLLRQGAPPVYRAQEQGEIASAIPEDAPLPRSAFLLRWSAEPEGARWDLRVTTEDLDPIDEAWGLEKPEHLVEPDRLASLPPGTRILWRVTAHRPDGRRVTSRAFVAVLQ